MVSHGTLLDRSIIIVVDVDVVAAAAAVAAAVAVAAAAAAAVAVAAAVADDEDGPTAASPLRVPGDTRTSVQCSELHSRPCARPYGIPGNAGQNRAVVPLSNMVLLPQTVLLPQACSAQRAPESVHRPPEQIRLVPSSTHSNTPGSSATRES